MKHLRYLSYFAALASSLILVGVSLAQHPTDQANPGKSTQGTATGSSAASQRTVPDATVGNTPDGTFAKKAATGGMAEVKLGQLAQQKASNEQVKAFGERMETDHSKAGQQLNDAAARSNVILPAGLDAKNQASYDKLSKLSGPKFDREYMRAMVTDHEEDVADFKREANAGKNPEIRDFASNTLPTLEDHLKQAREVAKSVGATTGSNSSNTNGGSVQ